MPPAAGYSCRRFRRTLNLSYYCIKWPATAVATAVAVAAAAGELINLCALPAWVVPTSIYFATRDMYILRIRRVEHAGVAENLSYFRAQPEKLCCVLWEASLLDSFLIGQFCVAALKGIRNGRLWAWLGLK